jgi:hypothetical protein
MDTINEPSATDRIERQREIIRHVLDSVAEEVENKLREVGLDFPIFLTVPSSGYAIATMATPSDPDEGTFLRAAAIVRQIISARLDGLALQSTALPCAIANRRMSAADLTVD